MPPSKAPTKWKRYYATGYEYENQAQRKTSSESAQIAQAAKVLLPFVIEG